MSDWQLSQGTVDFRNEERCAANQTEQLFDPKTTVVPKCRSCGTTRKNLCVWEADRDQGDLVGKRPRSCLNSAQLGPNDALPF